MDELIATERDADVRRPPADRLKEHQIARAHLIAIDRRSRSVLVLDLARQSMPVLGEHITDESAAVEPLRVTSAIAVRRTSQHEGGRHDRQDRW
jgi:hypothetical protein